MIPRWTEFVDKVIHWAERESNEKNVMFTVDKIDDNTIQITSRREKKVCRLKYARRGYTPYFISNIKRKIQTGKMVCNWRGR